MAETVGALAEALENRNAAEEIVRCLRIVPVPDVIVPFCEVNRVSKSIDVRNEFEQRLNEREGKSDWRRYLFSCQFCCAILTNSHN